jgi:3D (Asp-Asp-Asp) domain-containing protein
LFAFERSALKKLVFISAIALFGFLPVFGDEPPFAISIPRWFDTAYQYWQTEQITDKEFADAISFLENRGVMLLSDKEELPIADFLVSRAMGKQILLGHSEFSDCTAGWYITGYFTPLESDYSGRLVTVHIDGAPYKFKEDFVAEIKTEGWGRTDLGSYLGWYSDLFYLSEKPLDAKGNELGINTVAVDPSLIAADSNLTIPSLPEPWDMVVFTASDTGTAIIGKHVDVYTGEGKAAHDETYRITGHDNVVCKVE